MDVILLRAKCVLACQISLSRSFISLPKFPFWNTARKKQSSKSKPMGNCKTAGKNWISNQTKYRQFVRQIFERVVGTSNDLTRSEPCDEGIKFEILGVGEGIGGSKTVGGGAKSGCIALWNFK
ncbi:hypothetical protein AVEN_173323-1 [Araneus ventricosus]|uniref:Uncharacterized protein n=1 Tax=Araneus ventricosus TaxID=182803 RepID=A0A4Y2Q301_ARAVE|nr:hypothetical protein AVEN_173323-1 [Araneus ventricosus]